MGTRITRRFTRPRAVLAVEQIIEVEELLRPGSTRDSDETLDIVYMPTVAKADRERIAGSWWLTPKDSETAQPVMIKALGDLIQWMPGKALVEGKQGLREEIVAGLTEFAFYERELRLLEQSFEPLEIQARIDAPKTYRIQRKHHADWPRFGAVMEQLADLRLTFAILQPRLLRGSRSLTKPGREVASRLFRAAATGFQMHGLDDRLAVCEELYEGAIDRITDYHGWHNGHRLEVIIIALLLLEAILMAADLIVRS
jgi:hypothetical protein